MTTETTDGADVDGLFLEIYDAKHQLLRADRVEYDFPRPLAISEIIEDASNRLRATTKLIVVPDSFTLVGDGRVLRAQVER